MGKNPRRTKKYRRLTKQEQEEGMVQEKKLPKDIAEALAEMEKESKRRKRTVNGVKVPYKSLNEYMTAERRRITLAMKRALKENGGKMKAAAATLRPNSYTVNGKVKQRVGDATRWKAITGTPLSKSRAYFERKVNTAPKTQAKTGRKNKPNATARGNTPTAANRRAAEALRARVQAARENRARNVASAKKPRTARPKNKPVVVPPKRGKLKRR